MGLPLYVNVVEIICFVAHERQTKAALPFLRPCNGRIIFISSGAAVATYASWGAYGASKVALNHLAMTISVEEPNVTTISIRPGVVDTQMQQELRDTYASHMQEKDAAKFLGLHKEGKLLTPEKPGNVIAKLVLNGPKILSGRFLRQERSSIVSVSATDKDIVGTIRSWRTSKNPESFRPSILDH